MKKILLTAVGLAIATAPTAHADNSYKIIVNGQDVTRDVSMYTQYHGQGRINCVDSGNELDITPGMSNDVLIKSGKVTHVAIYDNYNHYEYPPGDAQFTQSGNTYNITGHISSSKGNVPFEFDATCP